MKIVADSRIPFLNGVFENEGISVEYRDVISPSDLSDADAMIVRTRTKCDAALLDGSGVRFIATATIGFDHIDLDYLKANGLGFSSSSGCNAKGVAQWVLAALTAMNQNPSTLGIVGAGHVGSELEEMAQRRGWKVLRNDPPRALREGKSGFVELDELLERSDVVTLHVPLDDTTRGLASYDFFDRFSGKCFLNSSRADVVDEDALMNAILNGKVENVALDVWKNEPDINTGLLERVKIGTPHIAGYSKRGKVRATEMAVRAVAGYFGIDRLKDWKCSESYSIEEPENYDIKADDRALRFSPRKFEYLRNNYNYR